MPKDVIVALDFPDRRSVDQFLARFSDAGIKKPYVKIGMELFYAEGPVFVEEIARRGFKIFLDLKIHDIPNTARGAMSSLSRLPIDMVNVHAGGGVAMMRAALEGLTRADGTRPLLIGVTVLTSISETQLQNELSVCSDLRSIVAKWAQNAYAAGLDGVVCSVQEVPFIKTMIASDFLTVTPGVRFPADDKGDQARTVTPDQAAALGSDYIVVGRPITNAGDPLAAYRSFLDRFIHEV